MADISSVSYKNQYANTNRVTAVTEGAQGVTQFVDFDILRPKLTKLTIARMEYTAADNKKGSPDYKNAVDAYFNPQNISMGIDNSAFTSGTGLPDPVTNIDARTAQFTTKHRLRTLNFSLFFDSFGMHASAVKGNRGAVATTKGAGEANTALAATLATKSGNLASYSEARYDVRTDIEKIIAWATVRDEKTHATAKVLVEYGKLLYVGVLTSISVQLTKFTERGVCVRATVNIAFNGFDDVLNVNKLHPAESPDTSKFHTMVQGEKLEDVSRIAYETPREWRAVARANNIANPRLVIPGDTLVMPAL